MNRLTEHDDQGNWCLKGVAWNQLHIGQVITKEIWEKLYGALWKLKDYEDTGLTPDDIMELKKFYSNPLNTAVPAVSVLPEKPLEEKIKDAIKLLRANEYVVKKWTPAMEHDADECERMDIEGRSKDCCGCACGVCLIQ